MVLLKNKSTSVGWIWLQCLAHRVGCRANLVPAVLCPWVFGVGWVWSSLLEASWAFQALWWGQTSVLNETLIKLFACNPCTLPFVVFCWQRLQCCPTKVLTCKENETIHIPSSLSAATEAVGDAGGSAPWHSPFPCLTSDPGWLEALGRQGTSQCFPPHSPRFSSFPKDGWFISLHSHITKGFLLKG